VWRKSNGHVCVRNYSGKNVKPTSEGRCDLVDQINMEPCEKKEYGTGKNMQRLTFTHQDFVGSGCFLFIFLNGVKITVKGCQVGFCPAKHEVGGKVILGTLVPGEFLLVWCGFIRSC
jgi:hypothetical protein